MSENSEKLKFLLHKLDRMSHQQAGFLKELSDLRKEILALQIEGKEEEMPKKATITKPEAVIAKEQITAEPSTIFSKKAATSPPPTKKKSFLDSLQIPEITSDLEKFIGENLINKIGIVIIVLGVAIGAKFAIENDLISPLTRIILGYLTGIGLMAFALKLKAKYENFSAVLLSGGIAIVYFITFAAYDFYALIPQSVTFGLMAVFTSFTVVAALHYNRQIISIFGLVGAYAIPFLLGKNSGNALFLFSYITLVNAGILAIAFKRNWKPLYYLSFLFTWLIFGSWLIFDYRENQYFPLAMTFLMIFFLLFYGTFLSYKLVKKEKFEIAHVILLLLNSFLFFGIGYGLLSEHATGEHLLGAFALANGLVHFGVASVIYSGELADKNLFYLVAGMVLVFITIAIPIQLDGSWVTLIWAGEAALLFGIGRTKIAPFYERLSYPVMVLGFLSLVEDWSHFQTPYWEIFTDYVPPILNIHFLTGILFSAAFGFILWVHFKHKIAIENTSKTGRLAKFNTILIGSILLISLYVTGFLEVINYWAQAYQQSAIAIPNDEYEQFNYNQSIFDFSNVWANNYTMLFCILLSLVNIFKIKNKQFGYLNLILNLLAVGMFLTSSLFYISELREAYLSQTADDLYLRGIMYLAIRYISLAIFAGLFYTIFKLTKADFIGLKLQKYFEAFFYLVLLWIASSELLHWLDFGGAKNQYKLGLSILWGVSSLILIWVGITQRKKFIRIGAMVLFAGTLVKLFFYDIAHLNTISKTIVLVSLGVLLLLISFLYNKFKDEIAENDDK